MATAITHKFGNVLGFGATGDPTCIQFDNRNFCQIYQMTDMATAQFNAALCTDQLLACNTFVSQACFDAQWERDDAGNPPTGWTWTAGVAVHNTGNTTPLQSNGFLTAGKTYKIEISVTRAVSQVQQINGTLTIRCGTVAATAISASGIYTLYITGDGTNFYMIPTSAFDGGVDYVNVYEIGTNYKAFITSNGVGIGFGVSLQVVEGIVVLNNPFTEFEVPVGCYTMCIADGCDTSFATLVTNGLFTGSATGWALGLNWAYSGNAINHSAGSAGSTTQTITGTILNRYYDVRFVVSGYSAGSMNVSLGGNLLATITADGTYTYTVISDGNDAVLQFTADSACVLTLDTVSVILDIQSYPQDLCSECIDLQTTHTCSTMLSWTNDDDAFDHIYDLGGSTFTHYMRVECFLKPPSYSEKQNQYTGSQGTKSVEYFNTVKENVLSVNEIPEYMHDALSIGKGHDHFYIGGVEYVCKDGYEPEFDEKYNIYKAPVKMVVRKKTVLMENKNCG